MSLMKLLVAAALALTASPVVRDVVLVAPAPVVAPAATQALASPDELQARVEIGPAVLRIYDAKGNVVAVE
jgi:hypothetical protein